LSRSLSRAGSAECIARSLAPHVASAQHCVRATVVLFRHSASIAGKRCAPLSYFYFSGENN
jgi:hypothetical protein